MKEKGSTEKEEEENKEGLMVDHLINGVGWSFPSFLFFFFFVFSFTYTSKLQLIHSNSPITI